MHICDSLLLIIFLSQRNTGRQAAKYGGDTILIYGQPALKMVSAKYGGDTILRAG